MSCKRWMSAAALLGLLGLSGPAFGDEKKVAVEDLPKAVLKAAKAKFPEAKIRGASKEVEGGETMYEVELSVDGKNVDLLIEPDGEIEAVEEEIDADDLPKAVVKAAKAKFPKGKIAKVEEITTEDDKVVYELAISVKGDEIVEVVMAPNGKILDDGDEKDKDKDDDDDEKKGKKKDKDDDEKGEKKPKG